MKKLMSLLVVAALVFASFATMVFAAETAKITVESVEAAVGEEVTVKVNIANNPGFLSAMLTVEYDAGLELVAINVDGMLLHGATLNLAKGIVAFASATNVTKDGTLMEVTFKVLAEGEHDVKVVVDELFTTGGTKVESNTEEGAVTVGHTCTLVDVAEVPATCTENGVMAHQKCETCGKLFLNGEEVTAEDLVIIAGHTFGEWSYDEAEHWYVCTVCGEECAREAHTWVDGVCHCGHENKGPAPTGDISVIFFALTAISGTALVALKKKED